MYDVDNANPSGNHPQITQRGRAATKAKDSRTHTKQHQIKFWGFGFRDNSCELVDRYVPSKLCSNNKKFSPLLRRHNLTI